MQRTAEPVRISGDEKLSVDGCDRFKKCLKSHPKNASNIAQYEKFKTILADFGYLYRNVIDCCELKATAKQTH